METRLAPRANISLKITASINEKTEQKFCLSGGNRFEVDLTSISILGVSVSSKYFLPKGVCLELEIDGKPFILDSPMDLKGEVRYCKQSESSKYKCGIKFIDINSKYKERIAEFVANYKNKRKAL